MEKVYNERKKKAIFIVKDYEDNSKTDKFEVENYYNCGAYYDLTFKNGKGSINKDRVIKILEKNS